MWGDSFDGTSIRWLVKFLFHQISVLVYQPEMELSAVDGQGNCCNIRVLILTSSDVQDPSVAVHPLLSLSKYGVNYCHSEAFLRVAVFCKQDFLVQHAIPVPSIFCSPFLSLLPGCSLAVWVFISTFLINVNPNLQPAFSFDPLQSWSCMGRESSHLVTIKVLIVGDGDCKT
jgi:hypothetical protein